MNNPTELTSKIGKEMLSVQRALGEKMGMILMTIGMTLSGMGIALAKGWSFSLVILAVFPFIALGMAFMYVVV